MSKVIFLIRHSLRADKETPELYQDWQDCPITNEGYKLAAEKGDLIRNYIEQNLSNNHNTINLITSPFTRTIQTADVLCSKLNLGRIDVGTITCAIDCRLAESHDVSTYPKAPVYSPTLKEMLKKGGIEYHQDLECLQNRTKGLLEELKKNPNNIIILVTHGAVYNSIISHLIEGFNLEEVQKIRPYTPRYCDVSRISLSYDGVYKVEFSEAECINKFLN